MYLYIENIARYYQNLPQDDAIFLYKAAKESSSFDCGAHEKCTKNSNYVLKLYISRFVRLVLRVGYVIIHQLLHSNAENEITRDS